jgi:hypothetical protein
MANFPPFLALALMGIGRAFDPDVLAVKIGIIAEGGARPATAIDTVADIHDEWLTFDSDAQRAT